eukprot:12609862-Alexandrium_andersonii.AAC.1
MAGAKAEGDTEVQCSIQLQRPMAYDSFEHEADEKAMQTRMSGECIEAETNGSEAEINELSREQMGMKAEAEAEGSTEA